MISILDFSPFKKKITVLGAFRTGTNYVRYLLESNYRCRAAYDTFGWKHSGISIFSQSSGIKYAKQPVVYISKNPASFVVSLYDYYLKIDRNIIAEKNWHDFLRSPIVIFDSKPDKSVQLRFSNPVQYWNYLYWNLSNLPKKQFISFGLRYESVIQNPEAEIEAIAQQLKLRRISENFILPDKKMWRMKDKDHSNMKTSITNDEFDINNYLNADYLKRYTNDDIQFLINETDQHLLIELGYKALNI